MAPSCTFQNQSALRAPPLSASHCPAWYPDVRFPSEDKYVAIFYRYSWSLINLPMKELKSQHKLRHVEGSSRLLESSLSFQDPDPFDMNSNFLTFAMWWKRSPPETNSITKKSLSVVWKQANMFVKNLRWEAEYISLAWIEFRGLCSAIAPYIDLLLTNLHSEPMANISLSNMQMSAQSCPRTSFLLRDLIAHSCLSDFLSARITWRQKIQGVLSCSVTKWNRAKEPTRSSLIFMEK